MIGLQLDCSIWLQYTRFEIAQLMKKCLTCHSLGFIKSWGQKNVSCELGLARSWEALLVVRFPRTTLFDQTLNSCIIHDDQYQVLYYVPSGLQDWVLSKQINVEKKVVEKNRSPFCFSTRTTTAFHAQMVIATSSRMGIKRRCQQVPSSPQRSAIKITMCRKQPSWFSSHNSVNNFNF